MRALLSSNKAQQGSEKLSPAVKHGARFGDIKDNLPHHVVFDRGALHTHNDKTGGWVTNDSSELQRIVLRYAGRIVAGDPQDA